MAALDHPFICHVHEVGEEEGTSFISMEHVQGQTLQDRLSKGPLEMRDALQKATEIAEALEAAHKQNIVHRDLKPANIMLTPEGHVKVMDFGLAKRLAEGGDPQDETVSSTLTDTGATLGTLPYMSPEQVRGQEVDSRSDIFSFGVLLYEMLTGVHPFKKDTAVETANSILNDVPRLVAAHVDDPPVLLQHTVKKMLAKETGRRYQLIHDVRTDLADLVSEITVSSEAASGIYTVSAENQEAKARPRWQRTVTGTGIVLAALTTGLLLGFVLWNPTDDTQSKRTTTAKFSVALPEDVTFRDGSLAVSPDGTRLVYPGVRAGTKQLYLRTIDQLESKPIPHTEEALYPFFSPDGEWIGFFSLNEKALKKVRLSGGTPQTLCEVWPFRGGSWGRDGVIVFGQSPGLWKVSETGGTPEKISGIPGEYAYFPQILPGGEAVIFNRHENDAVEVLSLETGERRVLIKPGVHPRYVSTGHLVYSWEGELLAAPFDPATFSVAGDSTRLLEELWSGPGQGGVYDISRSGTLAYPASGGKGLSWIDRQGRRQRLTETQRDFTSVRFSPDGKRLGLSIGLFSGAEVWIYELERGILSPLGTNGWGPIWTPDGSRLTFGQMGSGSQQGLSWMAVDGSGKVEEIVKDAGRGAPYSWSSDGNVLAFSRGVPQRVRDLLLLPLGSEPQTFLSTEFDETQPMFSPDDRWIAFTSSRSGQNEVYITPYPEGERIEPISTEGGVQPLWAHSGRELFYRNGENVMVVSIQTKPTFKADTPKLLFAYPEGYAAEYRPLTYDIAPDDQRFVFIDEGWPTQINVVLNWFEELKRLAPTDN